MRASGHRPGGQITFARTDASFAGTPLLRSLLIFLTLVHSDESASGLSNVTSRRTRCPSGRRSHIFTTAAYDAVARHEGSKATLRCGARWREPVD